MHTDVKSYIFVKNWNRTFNLWNSLNSCLGIAVKIQFERKFAFTIGCSVCTDARRVLKFHFCSPEEKDEEDE